ncbi:MAG: hypothetical protein LRY61_06285 [Burkholderiaceae bacterium]|nr:hypothetical protein [Burkholderiaceae bacterium]
MSRIVSQLQGRVRIRDHLLRIPQRMAIAVRALEDVAGISSIEGNTKTGSILLRFESNALPFETLESLIDAAIEQAARYHIASQNPSLKRQINRAAKVGMLGSLVTSMALLVTCHKKGHAAAGGVFLACLSVHTAIHRKSLIR